MNSAWALRASGGGRFNALRLWAVFVVGLAIGGSLSGTAVGLFAALLPWTPSVGSIILTVVLAVSLAGYDLLVAKVDLAQRRSLIPQEVFLRSQVLGFLRFGIEFGSGVRTFVTSASAYILVVMMLGLPVSFTQVVAVGLAFGLGRSVGPLQAILADDVFWSGDLERTSRLVERLGSVLAAAVTVTLAWSLLG
ncbi:MAG TPA: hypothetical protein VF755_02270 [Catenuloplanes sp.]